MRTDDLEAMWADLAPIGRAAGGGYFRQPYAAAERELRVWFLAQCDARGLVVEADGNGNLLGWWHPDVDAAPSRLAALAPQGPGAGAAEGPGAGAADGPGAGAAEGPGVGGSGGPEVGASARVPEEPREGRAGRLEGAPPAGGQVGDAVLTGSHLDSVLDGGAFDGPLGVVSALVAVDLLRERGVRPVRPLVVAAFAEEEGSRFGLACLGSRLAVGATTAEAAYELTDRDGVHLADAMVAAGLEPRLGRADWVGRVGCAVELHVEQGRDLVHRDRAVGLASLMWPHGRWRFDFTGEANHAGATRMQDRRDPMLTYAMTVLAANKQARLGEARATFGRVAVEPNGTNAVPSLVSAWLDARAATSAALDDLVATVSRQAADRADRDGTGLEVVAESVSPAVWFSEPLNDRLQRVLGPVPLLPSLAGHDAGVLAAAGVPTAMLFVRNPTGVSHSPAEHAETADCLAGAAALADVLEDLLT